MAELGPPTPLAEMQADIPQDLLAIVHKAMARDKELRYPTAKELAEDLRRFQTGQIVGAHQYSAMDLFRRLLPTSRVDTWLLHTGGKNGRMAMSTDGRRVFFVDLTGVLRSWNVETGKQAFEVKALPENHNSAIATSPAGEFVAIGIGVPISPAGTQPTVGAQSKGETGILLWDGAGRLAGTLEVDTAVNAVAFSGDGKRLAATQIDGAVLLFDVASRRRQRTIDRHEGEVYSVAFSPDDKQIVSVGKEGSVRLANLETGESRILQKTLPISSTPILYVIPTPGKSGFAPIPNSSTEMVRFL